MKKSIICPECGGELEITPYSETQNIEGVEVIVSCDNSLMCKDCFCELPTPDQNEIMNLRALLCALLYADEFLATSGVKGQYIKTEIRKLAAEYIKDTARINLDKK